MAYFKIDPLLSAFQYITRKKTISANFKFKLKCLDTKLDLHQNKRKKYYFTKYVSYHFLFKNEVFLQLGSVRTRQLGLFVNSGMLELTNFVLSGPILIFFFFD